MNLRLLIERFSSTRYGTVSTFALDGTPGTVMEGHFAELPWRENEQNRSCIPPNVYRAEIHNSPTFGRCLWLRDVPERTEILVHVANSPDDLDGCLAPGKGYGWWSKREEMAVWHSEKTLGRILGAMDKYGVEELDVDIRYWQPEYP